MMLMTNSDLFPLQRLPNLIKLSVRPPFMALLEAFQASWLDNGRKVAHLVPQSQQQPLNQSLNRYRTLVSLHP